MPKKKPVLARFNLKIILAVATATIIGILGISYFVLAQPLSINLIGSQPIPNQVDITVAGGGLGGVGAAIQAARLGTKVLLIEETDYLGGQASAAGVSSVDVGYNQWNQGLYREFQDKLDQHYRQIGKKTDTSVCWTGACYEPGVIRQIIMQMIASEPNITLLTRNSITQVEKQGSKIDKIKLKSGHSVKTKILIDATEYGDVIPLTGNAYRLGNSTSNNPNPNACIQDITYTAVIKEYPQGVPQNLRFSAPPPGYNDEVKKMFASIVTANGNSGSPLKYPVNFSFHNTYRGMPDSDSSAPGLTKTGVNWANDYPADRPYTSYTDNTPRLSVKYLSDKNYRRQINCEAKLRTIQFIYYTQTELGATNWSISNSEGYNTPYNIEENSCPNIPTELKAIEQHMPTIPYVRESIRGIGLKTLDAKETFRAGNPRKGVVTFPTSIAIGNYGTDVRNCNTNDTLETEFETWSDKSMQGPYQIPIETLIARDVDGLLFAEKNLSQTRMANGSTRIHPTVMLASQAAGALAAISVQTNTSPRNVPPLQVQRTLLAHKSILFPFSDLATTNEHFASNQELALRGITAGIGNFSFGGANLITRGQYATFLVRAFKLPTTSYQGIFADVPPNASYALDVESLSRHKITAGCRAATSTSKAQYCPNSNLTNAQFAMLSLDTWKNSNPNLRDSLPTTPTYSDVPPNHPAYRQIETLAARGIKWYCESATRKFCPNSSVTRNTASWVLTNILNQ